MSRPASKEVDFAAMSVAHAWWILLIAALALLYTATQRRIDRVEALTESPTWSVAAPPRDADSPTGYAQGQRRLVPPGHHNPSFWWIMEAQKAAAEGNLRLRHIDYDAPLEGRSIQRTAPYRGWLIATGWLYSALRDEPLGYSIERGALLADPILQALMLMLGATFTARFVGPFAAAGFVIGGISLFPLAANFQPGAPDPHALAWALALGSLLPLLASPRLSGAVRRPLFLLSGVFGGLGLWNDATSQAPVLLAIALGGLCYEGVRSRSADLASRPTSHWRAWAGAGALTTLAASVFEFAPEPFSGSLDAVNPVHALAWWGIGEALALAARWSRDGRQAFTGRSLILLGLAVLAIAAWPVSAALSDSSAGLLAPDFYARQLANHPSGGMAPGFGTWLARADLGAKVAMLLPCALLIALAARISAAETRWEERGRMAFLLVALLIAGILAVLQLRWWNLFDTFALVALTTLFAASEKASGRGQLRTLAVALLVLPGLFLGFPPKADGEEPPDLSPMEAQALVERDFAYWLNKRNGGEPIVLLSTPIFSGAAAYYGGFEVIVSSDAGNKTGFLTAARIASADSEQEVSILLNSRGITHVALPLWDAMLEQLVRMGINAPAGQALPPASFFVALRDWDVPPWMRPLNYPRSRQAEFRDYELRAFALQAEQAPELALSRLADLFVERGMLWEAESIRQALANYPRSVVALGAMANVDHALGDSAALEQSLEAVIPYLSRRSARNLPADRRLSLATLFMRVGKPDLARGQLAASFDSLDAKTLRSLSPFAVASLLALSRSLEIPLPETQLTDLALDLVPPELRPQLEPR